MPGDLSARAVASLALFEGAQSPTGEACDVACTACGCVCDDVRITWEGSTPRVSPPCPLAERWMAQAARVPGDEFACALVRGRRVSVAEGVRAAAELLRASVSPLVYGLSSSSTPGQRAAVELADRLGAIIDTSASNCHGPSILALQQVGESTCSLGEIRNRCDVVVYWGSNPVESHPRHLERYGPHGWAGLREPDLRRSLVVVDCAETETARLANLFVPVPAGTDFDVLWTLRALVTGREVRASDVAGVSVSVLRDLAARLMASRSVAFYFGRGLAAGPIGHLHVQALLLLARDLHRHTRAYVRRMRVYGDVTGADTVLCWQTGYPFSVNLQRGFPRYAPGEFSADHLLRERHVDAAVVVGTDSFPTLSADARAAVCDMPTILLDAPTAPIQFEPTVRFHVGTYGIHHAGTAYRMDEVPIPLHPFLPATLPSDEAVLTAITRALAEGERGQ